MSISFLESNGKNYFGDGTTLCCLVNPANVVSCPTENGYNKMRTCAFMPVCEVQWVDDKIVKPDWKVISNTSLLYNATSKIDLDTFMNQDLEEVNPKYIGVSKQTLREIINL